jgi:hypothetical protein
VPAESVQLTIAVTSSLLPLHNLRRMEVLYAAARQHVNTMLLASTHENTFSRVNVTVAVK